LTGAQESRDDAVRAAPPARGGCRRRALFRARAIPPNFGGSAARLSAPPRPDGTPGRVAKERDGVRSVRIVVTGASGFIGAAAVHRLVADGHRVVAVARRPGAARAGLSWVARDMRNSLRPEDWLAPIGGADALVNCCGVLQDGANDSTAAVHVAAPRALFAACERAGVRRVVHLSAIGVDRGADSAFARSKAAGDAALMATSLDWVILRPSVVVGRAAYGGSALFRALACLPVLPRIADAGALQIVQLDEVVATIAHFIGDRAPRRVLLEIAGPERLALDDVLAAYRHWLGLAPARRVPVPRWLVGGACRLGDLAGWLGWRPALRSATRRELARGATGDPAPWRAATGISPASLRDALAAAPATVQEKWFSFLYLCKPLILGTLSLFWVATGLIALGPAWKGSISLLQAAGVTGITAPLALVSGALADLCIGAGIAVRACARTALLAGLVLCIAYLACLSILAPHLWLDPLGGMLKILQLLVLSGVALAMLEDR
jgi:uncharacterized protein YbjT (DUF2867 family)